MKIIIMGIKGFVGKNLLYFIRKNGIDVVGFSSSEPGNIDPKTGVLSDEFKIPEGTTVVVYLSHSPYYRQMSDMFLHLINANVVSVVKLADLSRRAKVKRFIYLSSGNVYSPSFYPMAEDLSTRKDNWYSLSKIHAEESLSLFRNDMEVIIVRPFGIYGPGQTNKLVPNLLNELLQGQEIFIEKNPYDPMDLDGLELSLHYIEDFIKILYELIIDGGPNYLNIAGESSASIREIANIMGSYVGKEPRFRLSENYRQSDFVADITLLKEILNPKFTRLTDGLQVTVDPEGMVQW